MHFFCQQFYIKLHFRHFHQKKYHYKNHPAFRQPFILFLLEARLPCADSP